MIYTQAEVGYTTRNPPARVYDIEMVDTICTGTCFVYNAGFVVYLIEFIFSPSFDDFFKMTKK